MSKYTIQDTIEEDGIKVLKGSIDSTFFLINDYADSVGKDKYPDIDGQIRLRDGNGTYLNMYLHYQTKSHKNIRNIKKYLLNRKIIDYLIDSNVPTLFFIVETESKRSFWFFITPQIKREFKLFSDKKGRSIDLTKFEINHNSQLLNQKWQKFAKGDNYKEISNKLDKAIDKFKVNIQSCLGVLYLFGAIEKQGLPKIFSDLLAIEEHESITIISYLENSNIISSTVNYFLLENEKIGIESLFLLLDSKILDFINLDKYLTLDNKIIVFEQLNKINHPKVEKYFKALSTEFRNHLIKFKNNDDIFVNLELLAKYIYKIPNQAIHILKAILNSKSPLNSVTRNLKDWGKVEGKSHSDLVEKSIELLEKLRYIKPKETFSLLLKLSRSKERNIQEKASKSLEKTAEYNLFVLQKIGYQPQIFLLNEIEKFGNRKILTNFDVVITLLEQFIIPSFEGNQMTDYQTFTIRRGGLSATKDLEIIRERAIEILQNLFLLSKTIPQKKKILQVLKKSTLTPYDNYTKELEKLILENTNKIILFYNDIIKDSEYEIIKEIEEQLYWFVKRHSNKLKNIKRLQSSIAQNDEYDMFKVFVGHQYRFKEDLDWREAEKIRRQKVQGFIKQISNESFNEWQRKILNVINNYNQVKDYSRYQYFNVFLNELGKQKPKIAHKLIQNNESKLEDFLIHIIAGIWVSQNNSIAVKLIEDFIKKGKYLSTCAYIFSYINQIDEKILNKVFHKVKGGKDISTLNKIICSIVDNYPNDCRHSKLFMKAIKELTKLKSYLWINNVWFQKYSIIDSLSKNDFNIVLRNLLLVPDIDHHSEAILKTITKKHPLMLVKFFENRIDIQLKKKNQYRYDAIPYTFYELNSVLQQYANIIIPEVLKWFKKENWLFNWDGGRFLKNIYSINNLDNELVKLLNTGKEKDIKIVLSILNTYKGYLTLDSKAVLTLIRKYPKHQNKVISSMSASGGVVSGEYGFVNSLKDKKKEIQKWEKDKRKYIQNFVSLYMESLDEQINFEMIRADEDIELRRHEFK